MLEIGMKAPEFTLSDKDGNTVSLSDYLGRKVVVYFYPKDNTPGCTRQACAFAACKMARGEMVRYMAENQIEAPEQIKAFDRLKYRFDHTHSNNETYVFLRDGAKS